ncbi:MAG: S41 family peptidase [Pirellulales bacterium]
MQRRIFSTGRSLRFALLASIVGWSAVFSYVEATVYAQTAPAPTIDPLQDVLEKGQALESEQRWSEALNHYENALRTHPEDRRLSDRLDLAKIQYDLGRRYGDPSFRQALATLDARTALDLYAEVVLKIDTYYVIKPAWSRLVARGTRSLDLALSRQAFRQANVPNTDAAQIDAFRRELRRLADARDVRTRHDARQIVEQIVHVAYERIALPPTAVVFEYVCGASGGLDDYSAYLSGNQLKDIYSQIEGNFVGLGVELKADDGALLIVHVISGSPAERSGVRTGDRIVAVGGRSTHELSTDQAASLLQGAEGSYADITVVTPDEQPRRLVVRREHIEVPSVEGVRMVDPDYGIGYLKLSSFQKTTSRDLDGALWKLHRQGMRSLIMDLRGNPGGLLTSAVEVADKFIRDGGIVSTRGRNPQEAFHYDAHRLGTWQVPLVVLIDGDSASASEIFAAAIRDHRRGYVVGTRSYGKGSVQGIFPLGAAGAGIRLTTAKFFSPNGHPISHIGVDADLVVHQVARPADGQQVTRRKDGADPVLDAAVQAARRQTASR